MKSKAIVFPAAYDVALAEIDVPEPQAGQVLARTLLTGVSTGTETRTLSGNQKGGIFPLVPGYENLGEVIAVGEGVDINPGTLVFMGGSLATGPYTRCWGGQVEIALANSNAVVPVPSDLDPMRAIYMRTAAIALRGVRRGQVEAGQTVAIVGQGLIGYLAAQAALARGAHVLVVDPLEERLEAARNAGIQITINPKQVDVVQEVQALTGGVDVAIDATGLAATVDQTMKLLRVKPWDPPYPPSARLVLLGSVTDPICLTYSPGMFEIEVEIFVSRDCTRDDMVDAMGMIRDRAINIDSISQLVLPYTEAGQGYRELLRRTTQRVIFTWKAAE